MMLSYDAHVGMSRLLAGYVCAVADRSVVADQLSNTGGLWVFSDVLAREWP
jgi:hypothetical protein